MHSVLVRLPIGYIQLCKSVGTGVGTGPRQWNRKTVQKVNKLQLTLTINNTTGPGCGLSNSGPATPRLYWLWLCLRYCVFTMHDPWFMPNRQGNVFLRSTLGQLSPRWRCRLLPAVSRSIDDCVWIEDEQMLLFWNGMPLGQHQRKAEDNCAYQCVFVCVCGGKMSANEPIRRGNHLLLERIIIWSTHSPKNEVFSSVPARAVTLCYPHPWRGGLGIDFSAPGRRLYAAAADDLIHSPPRHTSGQMYAAEIHHPQNRQANWSVSLPEHDGTRRYTTWCEKHKHSIH